MISNNIAAHVLLNENIYKVITSGFKQLSKCNYKHKPATTSKKHQKTQLLIKKKKRGLNLYIKLVQVEPANDKAAIYREVQLEADSTITSYEPSRSQKKRKDQLLSM